VLETSRGNLGFALALGGVLIGICLAVNGAAFALAARHERTTSLAKGAPA